MGVTVYAYWPNICEEDIESQPGFYNDYKSWFDFISDVYEDEKAIVEFSQLGIDSLLAYREEHINEDKINWTTPDEMITAAEKFKDLLQKDSASIEYIMKVHIKGWLLGWGYESEDELTSEDFLELGTPVSTLIQDLDDIIALAQYAKNRGAGRLALTYS